MGLQLCIFKKDKYLVCDEVIVNGRSHELIAEQAVETRFAAF
jgi:hypothetical protein